MSYVIVKRAGKTWETYWEEDPKVTGALAEHSAAFTLSGVRNGVAAKYEDEKTAQSDCKRLNEANPEGDYAVCKLAIPQEDLTS